MIPKLSALKKRAQSTTALRGHRMQWMEPHEPVCGGEAQFAKCKCGCWVEIQTTPAPNGIDIGGSAVATNCTRVKNDPQTV